MYAGPASAELKRGRFFRGTFTPGRPGTLKPICGWIWLAVLGCSAWEGRAG